MNPFSYRRVATAAEAVSSVSHDSGALFLGGGTTLVDLMQLDVVRPKTLVDVGGLPLAHIERLADGGLRIGALVRNADLANDVVVAKRFPVLAEAILAGASPQIRNMATTGGNLLQRTRCPYFRDVFSACNKREPGSGCAAAGGYDRMQAILGTSEKCIATFPGDMPVALAAIDAVVRTRRPGGSERAIPIGDFYVSYGEDPAKENVLEHGELVVAVDLPSTHWLARSHYVKVRDRASYDFALASAAVALDVEGGRIRQARVALGGVATKPWRSTDAEKALVGAPPNEASYRAAAEAALRNARPGKHNAFKVELATRTLVRALTVAVTRVAPRVA
ncbi:MAG TPA: xanthine dehydrogenase family protein subunit M [Thermoanaerobaculia bacterium]|nr:xanthine dehydrogenase family protein subunit M [Thermoanaerobaculia bacterium]